MIGFDFMYSPETAQVKETALITSNEFFCDYNEMFERLRSSLAQIFFAIVVGVPSA